MKQIIWWFLVMFIGIGIPCCSAIEKIAVGEQRVFLITHADFTGRMFSEIWTTRRFESIGLQEISSNYFDRAMHTNDSKFLTVSFSRLLEKFLLKRKEDAVLLNCFDDYQGILSLSDILQYDLRLAIKIKLSFLSKKPDWLNPLLIIVPDGKYPPFQERFMTANIREIKFVQIRDYYAPLQIIAGSSGAAEEGLAVFKNNCLFCHSLKGRGGNKGVRLLETYDFSSNADRKEFLMDFKEFHHKNNPDKQDVEQFVTPEKLKRVVGYLLQVQNSK